MRDGIYKGLKLGRRWSTLLKKCEREADRGARTETAALSALESDVRRGVSPATVQELSSIANSISSLLPGFSSHELRRTHTNAARTPLEDAVWRHFHRVTSEGLGGDEAVHHTLCDAAREWGTRRFRQVQEHYLAQAGNAAQDVLGAAERAISAVNCDEIAARLIRGEKPVRPKKSPVTLDENLLRR